MFALYKTKTENKVLFFYNNGFKRQKLPDIRANVDSLPNNIAITMARTSMIDRMKAKNVNGAEVKMLN